MINLALLLAPLKYKKTCTQMDVLIIGTKYPSETANGPWINMNEPGLYLNGLHSKQKACSNEEFCLEQKWKDVFTSLEMDLHIRVHYLNLWGF